MPKLFSQIDLFNKKKVKSLETELNTVNKKISAFTSSPYYRYSPIYSVPFDGEKTPGEMGAAKNYNLLYDYLRVRSWQSYLESEITQIVINKYILWVVGSGLKVQPEPVRHVLGQEGITLREDFVKNVETRFNLWTFSRFSDSSRMNPIDYLSGEAFKNACIGGDCLVVMRVDKGYCNIQVIDGSHVVSPYLDNKYFNEAKARGNRIEYGIELSPDNEHIAYYIYGADAKIYRVPRLGEKSGRLMAFMVYGNKYRIDNVRGLPLIAAVMETLKKLDRYKEATVGAAEQAAKVVMSVEHTAESTGQNPFEAKLAQSQALGMGEALESKSVSDYEAAATKIATMTNNSAINMPVGAILKSFTSEKELYFKDFYDTNIRNVSASVGIPFEVAMSTYNSNYSASRAAIKDWEHSMKTSREKFAYQFYQNYYNLWLEVEVLNGKIQADGFMKAIIDNNLYAIEAYRSARWIGVNVPHIDPVKEVQAARLRLGDQTTPLTTFDQETEGLGTGDFAQNMERITKEKKLIPKVDEPKKNGQATAELIKQMQQ